MSTNTSISWTDATWSPLRARRKDTGKVGWHCEKISPGCKNCYAENLNGRNLPGCGTGLPYTVPARDQVEMFLDEPTLLQPLKWRKPRRIFVESMSDLFGEFVPDEMIDRVFAVMALCPQHTFQVLSKRAERMREYFATAPFGGHDGQHDTRQYRVVLAMCEIKRQLDIGNATPAVTTMNMMRWPLWNIHLGVSVENQEYADKRIPLLLQTPAAVRFVSYEPALGPVDFRNCLPILTIGGVELERWIDWCIVGGESGHGARPFDVQWARDVIEQCKAAGVACFVKQLGAAPIMPACRQWHYDWGAGIGIPDPKFSAVDSLHPSTGMWRIHLKDRKGSDMAEWPEHLRVREFPVVAS